MCGSKSPEEILRAALIAAACATLRQHGLSDTYVVQHAHEKLCENLELEYLTLRCTDGLRKSLGLEPLGLLNFDNGNLADRLR